MIYTKAYGCVNCHGLWKEREEKLEKIKEKYDIIQTFVKETHTYYTIKCKNCGHERTSTINNLYKHLDCGCSTGVYRARTGEEFIDSVNKYCQDEGYELVSEYKDRTTKVLVRHKACGFIWSVRPSDIIRGRSSCPKCSRKESKGARYIDTLLLESGLLYEKEKTLENSKQRFDFYLEKNGIKVAIEYNGIQHYKEVDFFETSLEQQQERDARKRQYCKENGIILIEIPYTLSKEEISDIITDIINRLNDQSEDVKPEQA